MKIKISSRQSALAQIQAFQVGEALQWKNPGLEVEYLFRESLGDQNQNDPLWKMPEKGVFTQDFLADLIHHRTDLVVHSWKDLPTETSSRTTIAATLPRADQRDLLLFKKSSLRKERLQFFSCSPRRSYNIRNFLKWALPWKTEDIRFENVRGNVQTRVRKLMESVETDGLIVAKAALDRLLQNESRFPDVAQSIRQSLEQLEWMVIPLSENPNAAAQGALAIEVARDRKDIIELVSTINCEASFFSAQREREILKEFGGGCHMALGMSVLMRKYGRIEMVRGLTPSGDSLKSLKFYPLKKRPPNLQVIRPPFRVVREATSFTLDLNLYRNTFVAKAEALLETQLSPHQLEGKTLWVAGLMTWKRLSEKGFWIHGCQEGLGETEPTYLETLLAALGRQDSPWLKFTLQDLDSSHLDSLQSVGTYRITYDLPAHFSIQLGVVYQWKSASEFSFALQRFPELKNCFHVCGPGRTYDRIKASLGSDEKIFVELSDEFITVV